MQVITFCMGIYKKQGIVLSTHNGYLAQKEYPALRFVL